MFIISFRERERKKADSQLSSCFISRFLYILIPIFTQHMYSMHVFNDWQINFIFYIFFTSKKRISSYNWISDLGLINQKQSMIGIWLDINIVIITARWCVWIEWIDSTLHEQDKQGGKKKSTTSSRYQMSVYSITTHIYSAPIVFVVHICFLSLILCNNGERRNSCLWDRCSNDSGH
jgi:hypothetical protein